MSNLQMFNRAHITIETIHRALIAQKPRENIIGEYVNIIVDLFKSYDSQINLQTSIEQHWNKLQVHGDAYDKRCTLILTSKDSLLHINDLKVLASVLVNQLCAICVGFITKEVLIKLTKEIWNSLRD